MDEILRFAKFCKKFHGFHGKEILERIQHFTEEQKKDFFIFQEIKEFSEEKVILKEEQEDQKFLAVADKYLCLRNKMKLKF